MARLLVPAARANEPCLRNFLRDLLLMEHYLVHYYSIARYHKWFSGET